MTTRARMPYFPFFVGDFLASSMVSLMSPCEVGAHVLLMCHAWGADPPASVPADDKRLAIWARMTDAEWEGAKGNVLAAWTLRDGRWYQPRLVEEWARSVDAKSAQIEGGRRGGLKSAQGRLKPASSQPTRVPQAFSDADADTDTDTRQPPAAAADATTITVGSIADATTAQDAQQTDPRLTALMSVGFGWGQAGGLLRRYKPTVEEVENYVARAMNPKVNSRQGFVTTCIREKWDIEAIQPSPDERAKADDDKAMREGIEDARRRLAAKGKK